MSVANEECVYLFNPKLVSRKQSKETSDYINEIENRYKIDAAANDQKENYAAWKFENDDYGNKMIKIEFKHVIAKVIWHSKGDYFATMAHNIQTSS